MPRLKGYRFPRAIVAYAVCVYHPFTLSTADVEDLLAERGVTVTRETVRKWVNRFGCHLNKRLQIRRHLRLRGWQV
ncbi:transposase-like protein [Sulfitobacter geojensis]|nr:transposase-like protein [Sulfitobacter geojensis]